MTSLDEVLDSLGRYRQRATYAAVGKVVNSPASFLMNQRPRDPRHSWVVNATTGMPTGYEARELHPDLTSRAAIIRTGSELEAWLEAPS